MFVCFLTCLGFFCLFILAHSSRGDIACHGRKACWKEHEADPTPRERADHILSPLRKQREARLRGPCMDRLLVRLYPSLESPITSLSSTSWAPSIPMREPIGTHFIKISTAFLKVSWLK